MLCENNAGFENLGKNISANWACGVETPLAYQFKTVAQFFVYHTI